MDALVLTNGDYGDYCFCKQIKNYAYIICADNGMRHARKLGINPHCIIGDFDSCNKEDLKYYELQGVHIKQLPKEKDETDTELAIEAAIYAGATHIDVFGGIGSRMDHSIANIQLLYKFMKQGVTITLHNDKNSIYLVKDKISLKGAEGDLVSLMPFSEKVTGITTTGLGYCLSNGVIQLGDAFGVSNYMVETCATITLESGILLVFQTKD